MQSLCGSRSKFFVIKRWPLQQEYSKWEESKSWGWRGRSLQAVVKDKDVILSTRESYWGVSIMHCLMFFLFFTQTLIYSQPLLLIYHTSVYKQNTSHNHKTSKLVPFQIGKFYFNFLGILLGNIPLFRCWEIL